MPGCGGHTFSCAFGGWHIRCDACIHNHGVSQSLYTFSFGAYTLLGTVQGIEIALKVGERERSLFLIPRKGSTPFSCLQTWKQASEKASELTQAELQWKLAWLSSELTTCFSSNDTFWWFRPFLCSKLFITFTPLYVRKISYSQISIKFPYNTCSPGVAFFRWIMLPWLCLFGVFCATHTCVHQGSHFCLWHSIIILSMICKGGVLYFKPLCYSLGRFLWGWEGARTPGYAHVILSGAWGTMRCQRSNLWLLHAKGVYSLELFSIPLTVGVRETRPDLTVQNWLTLDSVFWGHSQWCLGEPYAVLGITPKSAT